MSHPCAEYFPNQEVLHPQAVTIHTRGSNRRDESQVARLASAVPFEMYFPVCLQCLITEHRFQSQLVEPRLDIVNSRFVVDGQPENENKNPGPWAVPLGASQMVRSSAGTCAGEKAPEMFPAWQWRTTLTRDHWKVSPKSYGEGSSYDG